MYGIRIYERSTRKLKLYTQYRYSEEKKMYAEMILSNK